MAGQSPSTFAVGFGTPQTNQNFTVNPVREAKQDETVEEYLADVLPKFKAKNFAGAVAFAEDLERHVAGIQSTEPLYLPLCNAILWLNTMLAEYLKALAKIQSLEKQKADLVTEFVKSSIKDFRVNWTGRPI